MKRYLVKNCSPLCKLFDFFRNESSHLICARTILLSFIFILIFFFFFSRDERIDERISVIILLDRRNLIACIWTIPNNSFFPESNNKINGRKGGERQKSSEIGGGSGNVEAECKVSTYLLLCMNCVAHFFNKFLLILLHHFFVNCFIPCSFSFPFFFTHIAPYNHKNRIHELIL